MRSFIASPDSTMQPPRGWRMNSSGSMARTQPFTLTPGANGRLEIYLDGEKIFDRKEEDGKYPDLTRVRELRTVIQEKLDSVAAAADD